MNEIHILKGIGKLILTEQPNRILLELSFSRYGPISRREKRTLCRWLKPIYDRFESDPRPFVQKHPVTGQTAVLYGGKDWHLCIVK